MELSFIEFCIVAEIGPLEVDVANELNFVEYGIITEIGTDEVAIAVELCL